MCYRSGLSDRSEPVDVCRWAVAAGALGPRQLAAGVTGCAMVTLGAPRQVAA